MARAPAKAKAVKTPAKVAAKPKPKPRARRAPRKPARETIGDVLEPDWPRLLPDKDERAAASEHWRRVAGEMAEQQILSPSNGHALQRLVLAYLVYDRCSRMVAADGLVVAKSPDNPKSIDRLSIYYSAMREAEKTSERLEKQLGITPGNRGKVGKVTKRRERITGADAFLGPKKD